MAIGYQEPTVKTVIVVKTASGEERFDSERYVVQVQDGHLAVCERDKMQTNMHGAIVVLFAPGSWVSYRCQEEAAA